MENEPDGKRWGGWVKVILLAYLERPTGENMDHITSYTHSNFVPANASDFKEKLGAANLRSVKYRGFSVKLAYSSRTGKLIGFCTGHRS